MTTRNKFIVERTNVLESNKVLAAAHTNLDTNNFGWYGKAGEVYEFEAYVVYTATATTEGAAFGLNSSGTLAANSSYVSVHNTTDAVTSVRTVCTAFSQPAAGSASPSTGPNVATVKGIIGLTNDAFINVTGVAENSNQITALAGLTTVKWKRIDWPAEA